MDNNDINLCMCDISYRNGFRAGWNAALSNNKDKLCSVNDMGDRAVSMLREIKDEDNKCTITSFELEKESER